MTQIETVYLIALRSFEHASREVQIGDRILVTRREALELLRDRYAAVIKMGLDGRERPHIMTAAGLVEVK